jgi:hypothetical protein
MGYPFYYWPNQLMMNNGNGTFTDRASSLGIVGAAAGTVTAAGAGSAALDVTGAATGTVVSFSAATTLNSRTNSFNDRPYFFANGFPRKNFLELRLTGTRSNRDAIGAVARLWIGKTVMVRQVNPAGGYLAQSSRVLHFGLGDAKQVDSVVIRWPRGGVQTLRNPRVNGLLSIQEQ